ncbi:hypothetical protein, partial [Pseudomonas syringae group genomosp. 7]|uniref:hypothetical protein n=1 Tax=Pseudomonas syringae group genomosp. 7 TaxID=251699 RepID=UPI0037706B51
KDGFFILVILVYFYRLFAYLASSVVNSLASIASTTYGSGVHIFTVYGQIAVSDSQVSAGSAWRTVAYVGTGAGGKAFFA